MFERYSIPETLKKLKTDGKRGLTRVEANRRLLVNGPNEMQSPPGKNKLQIFIGQLQDPLTYVLLAAAFVSVLLKARSDAVIICCVVLLNATVGALQEGKAGKALEALKKMSAPKAKVIRDGEYVEIPAKQVVTGDLVCLEAGGQVPADIRLISSENLKIEESALTGEALPVEKDALFLIGKQVDTPLGDRRNMAYMSTLVTGGRGEGIAVATGMRTEVGCIADLIRKGKDEPTPLQKRLGDLGKLLSILTLGLCACLFGLALLQKREVFPMLLTAISLAVAAVPEGLPAVVTVCLALSVTRMVKVHTIIRRLPSVETLGAVNVVCTDKTGTLTQNKMKVVRCYVEGKQVDVEERTPTLPREFLWGMVLCNDGHVEYGGHMRNSGATHEKTTGKGLGDPTELALLELGERYGVCKEDLEKRYPRVGEIPFDSQSKKMVTYHKSREGKTYCFVKGAADVVLKECETIFTRGQIGALSSREKEKIAGEINTLAGEALRVMAVGMKEKEEAAFTFLGLVAMCDPLRPEALESVETFRKAGVRTVMITGDHVETACAMGKKLGIVQSLSQCLSGEELSPMSDGELAEKIHDFRVFARVSPFQKVRIVKAFQSRGDIVAMTGDGINDAPSLRMADIGIAMGKNGTDVAKQAADMILTDDNFASIEKAMEEGRGVYENIRKSVIFLLSSNLGELLTMFAAVLMGFGPPLRSCHILWINLITDSLPALALGVDKNSGEELMAAFPRKSGESLFARGGLFCTIFYGFLIGAMGLIAFLWYPLLVLRSGGVSLSIDALSGILEQKEVLLKSGTYCFTVLGISQLFHAIGMRDVGKSFFRMQHDNPLMIIAFTVGLLLQVMVTKIPYLVKAFDTVALSAKEWLLLGILSAVPLFIHEVFTLFSAKTICQY